MSKPRYEISLGKLARDGKKVMQFLERGKYIAVVGDGKVHLYPDEQRKHQTQAPSTEGLASVKNSTDSNDADLTARDEALAELRGEAALKTSELKQWRRAQSRRACVLYHRKITDLLCLRPQGESRRD